MKSKIKFKISRDFSSRRFTESGLVVILAGLIKIDFQPVTTKNQKTNPYGKPNSCRNAQTIARSGFIFFGI
jgi:hypothetical protein